MRLWKQSLGRLFIGDQFISMGYSGAGSGKNNPSAQNVPDVGPIPVGAYLMEEPRDTDTHGPYVIPLTPLEGTQMWGRAGFLLHGDSVANPGSASEGCIILPRQARELAWGDGKDRLLVVISGLA